VKVVAGGKTCLRLGGTVLVILRLARTAQDFTCVVEMDGRSPTRAGVKQAASSILVLCQTEPARKNYL
jgi:hypothetical protein